MYLPLPSNGGQSENITFRHPSDAGSNKPIRQLTRHIVLSFLAMNTVCERTHFKLSHNLLFERFESAKSFHFVKTSKKIITFAMVSYYALLVAVPYGGPVGNSIEGSKHQKNL